MQADAMTFLFDKGKAAASPVVELPGVPNKVLLRQPDGQFKEYDKPPAPRQHTALSAEALVAAVAAFKGDTPAVWYGPAKVVAVLDNDRRETVTYHLGTSRPFDVLRELEKSGQAFDQRSLVKLLRTTFKACLGQCPTLVETVRRVRLVQGSDAAGEVQHGKSSVGKSITAEVTGTGKLPEYVVLTVPVFRNPDLPFVFPVECAFEPNPDVGTFQLIPLPGELDRAQARAEQAVGTRLAELVDGKAGAGAVEIINGTP